MDIPQTVLAALRIAQASGKVDMQDRWQVTKFVLFDLQETQAASWLQQNRTLRVAAVSLASEGVIRA